MKMNQREVIDRLKSAEGHVRGIQRMVEDDRYCIDVIRQIQAVQQALERVKAMVLEGHLQNCVTSAIRSDDVNERERVIAELMDVFDATGAITRGGNHGSS